MRNDNASFASTDVTHETDTVTTMEFSYVNVGSHDALSVSVTPENSTIGIDSSLSKTLVCVTMKACDLPDDDDKRAPVDIVVALDVSYSMLGNKLEMCKKTLELLLKILKSSDRFGLVVYSDNASIAIPAQKMTAANKQTCVDKIKSIKVQNSTNISAGIGLAYQEMKAIDTPNEVQTVFLLTDGLANTGICDESGLVEMTANCFLHGDSTMLMGTNGVEDQKIPSRRSFCRFGKPKKSPQPDIGDSKPEAIDVDKPSTISLNPIALHCFGYGSDHNSTLLRNMASVTQGGSYYFVENDNNVGSAFGDALGGILSVVCQNVVVTISIPDTAKEKGVEVLEVYHDQKIQRENSSFSVVCGDFYAEESRDILFAAKLANDSSEEPLLHANVSVSYTDTLRKMPVTCNEVACLIGRPSGSEVSESDHHVSAQWLRIESVKAMAEADQLARSCNYAGAQQKMRKMKARIKASSVAQGANKAMMDELVADMDQLEMKSFASGSMYTKGGTHCATNTVMKQQRQRCMRSDMAEEVSAFESKKKTEFRFKLRSSTNGQK